MLDHPTHQRLRDLKLVAPWVRLRRNGMTDAFAELQQQPDAATLRHAEWLGLLIDREATKCSAKRYQTRMRAAKLRHVGAAIEDVDYRTRRQLDRNMFRQLAQGDWIAKGQNLIITGPCGVGKTWLACALGQKACRDGRTVLYRRLPRLFAELELAHGDGSFPRLFRQLVRANLLILDDWGPDRLTRRSDAISWKSSKTATETARSCSPASCLLTHGTMSSASRHSPTPYSIGSSTTPTDCPSTARQCESNRHDPRPAYRRARRRASAVGRARRRARLRQLYSPDA